MYVREREALSGEGPSLADVCAVIVNLDVVGNNRLTRSASALAAAPKRSARKGHLEESLQGLSSLRESFCISSSVLISIFPPDHLN